MKKAREIEIPEDRPLTFEEFTDFKNHAYNSSSWYATEYVRTEKQIRDKLLKKGYINGEVDYLNEKGVEESFDIIEWVLEKLRDYLLIDDDALARRFVERELNNGKGAQWIHQKLSAKGISHDRVDELIEEMKSDDVTIEGVERVAERYMRNSTYLKQPDKYKKRQKLVSHIISRGFSFDDITLWETSKGE